AVVDGTQQDGASTDVVGQDGTGPDGVVQDGATLDGAPTDAQPSDAQPSDAPVTDANDGGGTAGDGTAGDGATGDATDTATGDSIGPPKCTSAATCPAPSNPCLVADCHPQAGCIEVALPSGTACNDGSACTTAAVCEAGVCKPSATLDCDDGLFCTVDSCDKDKGCANLPAAASPCDDGNPCTLEEACDAQGSCSGGINICACQVSADCAAKEDGNLCNGTLFCEPKSKTCQINPATVVTCNGKDDTTCAATTCDPKTGTCALQSKPEGTACDDGVLCTVGDACDAKGQCQPGTQVCCKSDADCGKFEDGDACNGTLFCNKASGSCELNPTTVVVCPSAYDTACRKNLCDKSKGTCGWVQSDDGTACDDGSACTPNEACKAGECVAGASLCECKDDADCEKFEDGNLCNGTLYCDPSGDIAICKVNPVTVVKCDDSQDTTCAHNVCTPSTGACKVVPRNENKTCDADGNPCTPKDLCKSGSCVADTNVCICQTDTECQGHEDGNLCNGTLFCDKGNNRCQVNPATVVSCPTGLDTGCQKSRCQPLSGTCKTENVADFTPCDADDTQCTLNDACIAGTCKPGQNLCQCKIDGHCGRFDDKNQCNGSLYCDKAKGTPYACIENPGTAVWCDKSGDGPCQTAVCDPKTGDCGLEKVPDGQPCTDGTACEVGGLCAGGDCKGTTVLCDDGNPCTTDACNDAKGCISLPAPATACDDANDCSADSCDPKLGCVHLAKPQGALCSDGDACTSGDTCAAGVCAGGKVLLCDDGNACTNDSCDPKQAEGKGCLHTPVVDGKVCDDGNACTVATACNKGQCSGKPKNCDDGDACTTDGCNPSVAGGCLHVQKGEGVACDDGKACTEQDACDKDSVCAGKPKTCDDGNACTKDACDESTDGGKGGCVALPAGGGCDDGDACTDNDYCKGGACLPGEATVCNDGNPCTDDSCDKAANGGEGGCVFANKTGACDDGDACTEQDACAAGQCKGKAKDCDDDNVCTDDSCHVVEGCQNAPNTAPCGDGDACTTQDACKAGKCGGKAKDCDDGDACTTDGCDKGVCTHAADVKCDDGDACTTDSCDKSKGCVHVATGGPCDDGDPCTAGETCTAAGCVGAPKNCDDSDPCTDDVCAAGKGCVQTANTKPCNDGDACTSGEVCATAGCGGGVAVNCDDGEGCTIDACNKTKGCIHSSSTLVCDDGDACTTDDVCKDGACSGKTTVCDDGDPCTVDACDAATGACKTPPAKDGTVCGDGTRACIAGVCKAYVRIRAAYRHTCAERAAGGVDCWGSNASGELGRGVSTGSIPDPGAVKSDAGIVLRSPVTLMNGACALDQDGKAWCWGSNGSSNRLGINVSTTTNVPLLVQKQPATFVALEAGQNHICGLGTDARIYCWGAGNYGQVGNGLTNSVTSPTTALGVLDAVRVRAGANQSGAIFAAAKPRLWGNNGAGELGMNDTYKTGISAPTVPAGGSPVAVDIAFGLDASAMVDTEGQIWSAGQVRYGRLGIGLPLTMSQEVHRFIKVPFAQTAAAVYGGWNHLCARDTSGALWCWGRNDYGQLGLGDKDDRAEPTQVPLAEVTLAGVVDATTGDRHMCVVDGLGQVICWGNNSNGQLGTNSYTSTLTPTLLVDSKSNPKETCKLAATLCDDGDPCTVDGCDGQTGECTHTAGNDGASCGDDGTLRCAAGACKAALGVGLAVGEHHACLRSDVGKVRCWGDNDAGQLGDGGIGGGAALGKMVQAGTLAGTIGLAAGGTATCDLLGGTGEGTLACWGEGETTPKPVSAVDRVTAVAVGAAHRCVIRDDGYVRCWGEGKEGQLGDGKAEASTTPRLVGGVAGARQVVVGQAHSCALGWDGTVHCWGRGDKGQLGHGKVVASAATAQKVSGVNGAVALAAGRDHSCALLGGAAAGKVLCWGAAADGQTGTGVTATAQPIPTAVTGLGKATAIGAGSWHSCAVTATGGKVACWGRNDQGQLGDGSATNRTSPVFSQGLGAAVAVGGGAQFTCALGGDGAVRCVGAGGKGELGGAAAASKTGVVVVGTAAASDACASVSCDDGIPCTIDRCERATGTCVHVDAVDGSACGTAQVCVQGQCRIPFATALSAGDAHSLARAPDGGLLAWGAAEKGQLLNETVGGVTAIAAGGAFSCVLRSDGTILCGGAADRGQLGHGATTASGPVVVDGLSDGTAVVAGGAFACALRKGGAVRCWGANDQGQLGDGTHSDRSKPVDVALSGAVARLSAGTAHACALGTDGKVRCWGDNSGGELGDGTTTDRSKPVLALGLAGAVVDLWAGEGFSCARLVDGRVQCWGAMASSGAQAGVGATIADAEAGDALCATSRFGTVWCWGKGEQPQEVSGLPAARSVVVGKGHRCALLRDGSVRCWGKGGSGQLGDGKTDDQSAPVQVQGSAPKPDLCVEQKVDCDDGNPCTDDICDPVDGSCSHPQSADGTSCGGERACNAGTCRWAAEIVAGRGHSFGGATCVRMASGKVRCWGSNNSSSGGLGFASGNVLVPTEVPGLQGVTKIAGAGPFCARVADGTLRCWGANNNCQLGRAANATLVDPGEPLNVGAVEEISAGKDHVIVRRSAGDLLAWGHNTSGQFGVNGSTYGTHVCIADAAGSSLAKIVRFGDVYEATMLGFDAAGTLFCWGENYYGQCGNNKIGSNADLGAPLQVATDVVAAASGAQHACYADKAGNVYCAGTQYYGQTGTGTVNSGSNGYESAFSKTSMTGAVEIAAGAHHTCALKNDGTVYCWGRGNSGQLGIGNTQVAVPTPTKVVGLTDVVQLALAVDHSCALKKDGSVWCWGDNGAGEMGNGEFGVAARKLVPNLVPASKAP
ncbi:MAG: hypothetical protein H6835_00035, partial [Planctomycetes bacterium]|nr:hypothetical protein [Planctomycetota bacterium]